MTNQPEKSETGQAFLATNPTFPDPPRIDGVLQAVVDLVNTADLGMGITLCVGGVIVSGQLISGKQYFAGIAKDALRAVGAADQHESRNPFSEYLGNFGKVYERTEDEDDSEETDDEAIARLPFYIHLGEAKFFHNSGQPMPTNAGIWWRGRLSAVDGFSFGALTSA